jgi:two-component system LytT family sensor kinase
VRRRDTLELPSFWPLQLAGWGCFCVLIALVLLPDLGHEGIVRGNFTFTLVMFAASCVLHPWCKRTAAKELSWFAVEVRAFACSLLAGMLSAFAVLLTTLDLAPFAWREWLFTTMQSTVLLFLWCSLYFSIKQWQQGAHEREGRLRAESDTRQARLNALRYQLNPHLLFNSLNAVSTLVHEGQSAAATSMLAQIGALLRSALDQGGTLEVALSSEVDFIERYLAVERIRLGERLQAEIIVAPNVLQALIPSMLLQPLVENAVQHGIAPLIEGGIIRVKCLRHGQQLQISVRNSGPPNDGRESFGIVKRVGLGNTAERLRTRYGERHQFELRWPPEGGCEVLLELPFVEMPGELRT